MTCPPEQQESYLRTRRLTSPRGIKQTVADLDEIFSDPRQPQELRDLTAMAADTILQLCRQLDTERALASAERFERLHDELDLSADFAAEGQTYAELDDDGNIVTVGSAEEATEGSEDGGQ